MLEKTFAIIKPDAVAAKNAGKIIDRIEAEGFTIKAMKKIHMTKAIAERFYFVHRERPFYNDLTNFMSSGPCIVNSIPLKKNATSSAAVSGASEPCTALLSIFLPYNLRRVSASAASGLVAPIKALQPLIASSFSKHITMHGPELMKLVKSL